MLMEFMDKWHVNLALMRWPLTSTPFNMPPPRFFKYEKGIIINRVKMALCNKYGILSYGFLSLHMLNMDCQPNSVQRHNLVHLVSIM
jgi:hypothetical protein